MTVKHRQLLVVLLGFLTIGITLARETPPSIIRFEARIGSVHAKEGNLMINLSAFYDRNMLVPKFELDFEQPQSCAGSGINETCKQTSYLDSFNSIDEMISVLAAGLDAFDKKQRWSGSFKLCEANCVGACQSIIVIDPELRTIQFVIFPTSSTSYRVSLDRNGGNTLLHELKNAEKLQKYLAPQFRAFNGEKPDSSAGQSFENE